MTTICAVLGIARRSAYYVARPRPAGRYQRADDGTVLQQIRAMTNSRAPYGYRRVWAMVNRTFRTGYNRKRLRRVMQLHGLFIYRDGRVARVDYQRRGTPTRDLSFGVASVPVDYSGNTERRSFVEPDGRPAPNAGGVYAIQLKHDGSGNPIEWRNLGPRGELIEDKASGLAVLRWRYDFQGRITEGGSSRHERAAEG